MRVGVRLLGGFTVLLDGVAVPEERWRRSAAALVKLLALASGGRLHRDRVVDALWPDLTLEQALPRLHKAAHYARRATDHRDAVVLRGEAVALFPEAELAVDALEFETAAETALSAHPPSPEDCGAALALAGDPLPEDLLPDDLVAPWLDEPRERLRLRVAGLLRGARRWEELLRLDPVSEEAHVELLREAVLAGDRSGALRRYRRMEHVLETELGLTPGPEAVALRERILAVEAAPPSSSPVTAGNPPATPSSPAPALVDRDGELQVMESATTAAVDGGRGVVVLVSGEAGAGKSALVRAYLDRLGPGVTRSVGGCDDLLAPRSLGPFRDMAASDRSLADVVSQPRLDDVLTGLLRVFASRRSVVVVEDVHWADDATLDAVRYLSRRVPGIAAVLVLTFREPGLDAEHPLRQILGSLAGPTALRVTLSPLTVEAVRRLAGGSRDDAVEIHRVTEGNPFFVTEVLASGGTGVPPTVRDAVLARLGRVQPPTRRFLEHLSVVPTRVEPWLADALSGGEPGVLVEAERSGVITTTTASVAFRHELARQAVESALTAGERLRFNRLVLDALLGRPDLDPSRVVHHAARAGQVAVVLEHGPPAAHEAARLGAHRQAAEILRVVLEHGESLDLTARADLLSRRAYSLYVVNRFEAAFECAEAAVRSADQAGDVVVLADALLVLARAAMFARGPMRARAAAQRAVELLEPMRDDARLAAALTEAARAHSNLPTGGVVAEPSEPAEAFAGRALVIGERLGRADLSAQALFYRGDARLARGDGGGATDLERAVALAGSDSRVELRVRSYVNASCGALRSGRLDEAARLVAAGLRVAADGEFFAGQYRLRLTAAAAGASSGDWDRAVTELRSLMCLPGEPGVMAALARSLLARLLARRGDHGGAADVLAPAELSWAASDDSFVAGPLAVAQVELGWLDGSLGSVTHDSERVLDVVQRCRHRSMHAELCAYLRRAGIEVPGPADPPGPWEPTLARRWREAAAAWAASGDRYEEAVVLATAPDQRARMRGARLLEDLGAVATLAAV